VLAFTFPGQGSQRPGMGASWVDHPSWEVVDEATELSGRDVGHLLLHAEEAELTLTANAQLATFILSLVILDAIERVGLAPTLCAGHSLGEYTALVASGAMGFDDGVRLVVERGEAMHQAAVEHPGTMAAVLGADDDAVEAACQRAEGDVWVANYNAPGQVVIAGDAEAVGRAGHLAKELGARRVMPFPVAGAFHTALMAPARSRLRKALGDTRFLRPEVPVVANVDARVHDEADDWPGLLSAQLCAPVRWRQSLETAAGLGATLVAEVGPGGVLTALTRRVLPDDRAVAVGSPGDLDPLVDAVAGSDSWLAYASEHQGEHLHVSDRVVVSPASGLFQPAAQLDRPGPAGMGPGGTGPGRGPDGGHPVARVVVGDVVGQVAGEAVRTPFAGDVVAFLAHPGERVVPGQPVVWLRVAGDAG
jgi:[acyl-carrier-protein] S-malonyltransferase